MKVNPINPIDKTIFNIKPNPNRQQDKKDKKKSDFAEIFEKTLEENKNARKMSEGEER